MIIKSVDGKTIFESETRTLKRAVEEAVSKNVSLAKADLRKANLKHAELDNLYAPEACFWGADFTGADMALSCLQGCDLRNACFENTCLAHAVLSESDMRGAFFSKTLLEGADLSKSRFSCPSLFECDLRLLKSMANLSFVYKGEKTINIMNHPIVVKGFAQTLIMTEKAWICNGASMDEDKFSLEDKTILSLLRASLDLLATRKSWQNAKHA